MADKVANLTNCAKFKGVPLDKTIELGNNVKLFVPQPEYAVATWVFIGLHTCVVLVAAILPSLKLTPEKKQAAARTMYTVTVVLSTFLIIEQTGPLAVATCTVAAGNYVILLLVLGSKTLWGALSPPKPEDIDCSKEYIHNHSYIHWGAEVGDWAIAAIFFVGNSIFVGKLLPSDLCSGECYNAVGSYLIVGMAECALGFIYCLVMMITASETDKPANPALDFIVLVGFVVMLGLSGWYSIFFYGEVESLFSGGGYGEAATLLKNNKAMFIGLTVVLSVWIWGVVALLLALFTLNAASARTGEESRMRGLQLRVVKYLLPNYVKSHSHELHPQPEPPNSTPSPDLKPSLDSTHGDTGV